MTRLVLLEFAPERFAPGPDDVVVALTPDACYELDRRGRDYRLATDFGLDAKIAALDPLHWQEQLRWLTAFDEVVALHVPQTERWRFGAATLYGYDLKTFMDPVRIRALELESMLDSSDRVLLYRRVETDPPVSRRLPFQGPSVTSLVLPLVAAARGISCEERVDEHPPPLDTPAPLSASDRHADHLGRLAAPLRRGARALRRLRPALIHPGTRGLTLLFADSGYDLAYLLARAREQGHRCLRIVGDTVVEEGRPGRKGKEIARLPVDSTDTGWIYAAEAVARAEHPLWDWPNGWFPGIALADLLRPRIFHWLRDTMPVVAARAAVLDELIESQRVDFVLGANITSPDVLAAAAVTALPTQSVLIDHGDSASDCELFDLTMLRHVDHNFCPTSELAEYMELRRRLYDHPTAELQVGSYRWRANASPAQPAKPPQPVPDETPLVVYALTATAGNARYLNNDWYSDGWYYRLCREIVDVLARHPEVFSVVKLFPGDGHVRNPIDLYVDGLGLDHVVSSRAPLRAWIPCADRIVFDFPSTGLYETAVAGVPYLALLYSRHRHRPAAVELLGPAAVRFTEPPEAASAVEAFVSPRAVTAPRLCPEGEEILATLERLARR